MDSRKKLIAVIIGVLVLIGLAATGYIFRDRLSASELFSSGNTMMKLWYLPGDAGKFNLSDTTLVGNTGIRLTSAGKTTTLDIKPTTTDFYRKISSPGLVSVGVNGDILTSISASQTSMDQTTYASEISYFASSTSTRQIIGQELKNAFIANVKIGADGRLYVFARFPNLSVLTLYIFNSTGVKQTSFIVLGTWGDIDGANPPAIYVTDTGIDGVDLSKYDASGTLISTKRYSVVADASVKYIAGNSIYKLSTESDAQSITKCDLNMVCQAGIAPAEQGNYIVANKAETKLYIIGSSWIDVYALPAITKESRIAIPMTIHSRTAGLDASGNIYLATRDWPIASTAPTAIPQKVSIISPLNISSTGYAYIKDAQRTGTGWRSVYVDADKVSGTEVKVSICASDTEANINPPFTKCTKSTATVDFAKGETTLREVVLPKVVVGKYASVIAEMNAENQYVTPTITTLGASFAYGYTAASTIDVPTSNAITSVSRSGRVITIRGVGFGTAKGRVKFNTTTFSSSAVTSWTDTQINISVNYFYSISGGWEVVLPTGAIYTYTR